MEVKWLGHSCFKLTHQGHSVVIDPFQPDSVPGLRNIQETADLVLCSHGHFDHDYADGVIIPADAEPDVFQVTKITVCHDDANGSLRGMSDIHIIEIDGYKVAHFGDIGCGLTDEQKAMLSGLDLALVPVGGYYTIDALQAAVMVKELKPCVTIPMHYSSDGFGFDEIGRVDAFVSQFEKDNVHDVKEDTVSIEKGMAQQVIVLEYRV